ncbi:MAG TPA: EAL domain-containing protein [Acidobacteriaceae bacterium]|nr:EAL domain-containing protein [Acidobacteriaceae bacterium]
MSSKLFLSSRAKTLLSFALFAPAALILLTGPSPSAVLRFLSSDSAEVPWKQLGHRALVFSLVADVLAWMTCALACLLIARLAYRLRDRVPYAMTTYILGLFIVCFGVQRMIGYALWIPLGWLGPHLEMVRAAASVIVAMGVAVLYPYMRAMLRAVMAATKEHEKFEVAAESSLDAFYILESVRDESRDIVDFRFSYVNANGEKRLGKTRRELLGKNLTNVLPFNASSEMLERYKQVVLTGNPYIDELEIRQANAEPYWIVSQVVKLGDGIALTNRDVTEERARLREIARLHEFTQSMIENAPFSIIATDPAGTVTAMNPAAEALTHYRKQELIGQHSVVMLHDAAEMSARAVQLSKDLQEPVQAGFGSLIARPRHGQTDEHEWTYIRKDGSRIWVNLAMTALKTTGDKIAGYVGIAFDITERKKLTEYVNHLAHHDQLTGLPNRVLLEDRMRQAIQRAKRNHHKVALLMVDVDYFKRINDSLGHTAGDALLDLIAKKLCSAVRQTDTVARMGGDEFVIIMPEFRDEKDAERCAENIIQKVSTPAMIGNREVNVTVSVGLCIFPDCAPDADALLKNADAALYEAKESGRNSFHVFNEGMVVATADKIEFEHDLRHAMVNGELSLEYQPQVSCVTGDVIGVEALLRWTHPRRGNISPSQFIPLAEATGMILPIGEWTIRMACHEGKELHDRLGRELMIAVNLSPRQFRQKNLVTQVAAALRESGLPPHCLEFEITEQTLMSSSSATNETLMQLRKLGVKIAIDDFGTGFSSFSYLLQYEVDRLKIDRSFVHRLADDPNAAAIVRAIISMAHGLNLKVVAEGVETNGQLDFLLTRNCDEAQGFYFAEAVPAEEVMQIARTIQSRRMADSGAAIA